MPNRRKKVLVLGTFPVLLQIVIVFCELNVKNAITKLPKVKSDGMLIFQSEYSQVPLLNLPIFTL